MSAPWSARGIRQADDEVVSDAESESTSKPKETTPEEQLDELMQQVRDSTPGDVPEELLAQMRPLWNQDLDLDEDVEDHLKRMWGKRAELEARAWFASQQQGDWTFALCAADVVEGAQENLPDEESVAQLCARFDRGQQLQDRIRPAVKGSVVCLPNMEDYAAVMYTPDYDHWKIVTSAAKDLLGKAAVKSLCGEDEQLAKAPWDKACVKSVADSFLGIRKEDHFRKDNCGTSGVSKSIIQVVIENFRNHPEFFAAYFGFTGVCLAKLSSMISLDDTDLDAQLTSMITEGIGLFCMVPPKPDAECKEAPSLEVEECSNALLQFQVHTEDTGTIYVVPYYCKNDALEDFAASPESGHMKFIHRVFYTSRHEPESLHDVPYACTQSNELLQKAALAAFQCGCPWKPDGGRPPVIKPAPGSIYGMSKSEQLRIRASHWKNLLGHSEGLSENGTELVNSIATLPEERPKTLKGLLELATYPNYADGPLAHLDWDNHHDTRFKPSYVQSSFDPHASQSNPTTLRLFRFGTDEWEYSHRLANTNAGDMAHVCGWGSAIEDANREGKSDYALLVYTIETDGTRAGYAKCNGRDCGTSMELGWRFRDVGREEVGCLKGEAAWYSLPVSGSNERNWQVQSLDRVISWKCVRDQGLFERKRQEFYLFADIDKILFTLDGCHMCPDVMEPDDTPRRVCPRAPEGSHGAGSA